MQSTVWSAAVKQLVMCFSLQARRCSGPDQWKTCTTVCRESSKEPLNIVCYGFFCCCWVLFCLFASTVLRMFSLWALSSGCHWLMSSLFTLPQTDALKCVAQASKNRSLADFEKVRACQASSGMWWWWMLWDLNVKKYVFCPFCDSCLTNSHTGTERLQSRAEGRPHYQHTSEQAVWQSAGAEPHQSHWAFLQSTGRGRHFTFAFICYRKHKIIGIQ